MSAWIASVAIVTLFTGATLLSDTLPRRRWLPVLALGVALFLVFLELARYDHGFTDAFFWIGWVGAPLVAIFGGASWGTRHFYGWPDLGPHPSRAGLVAGMIIAGVVAGVRMQQDDVERSMRTGEALAREVATWQTANDQVPSTLEAVTSPVPRTHMGWIAPPPYRIGTTRKGAALVAFPVGGTAWMTYDIGKRDWSRRSHPPRPVPEPEPS